MMDITGKTRICGIIGDPVEHSMSPAMHNAAFEELGLDNVYVPFAVKPERLAEAVAGLRALNVTGFSVTIPHKVAVIPLLDSLDPLAEKIGAVNTVVNSNGQLRGFNTDVGGFTRSLEESGVAPAGKKTVVLGAGGASRAVSYALAGMGAVLTIVCRKEGTDRAAFIASLIKEDFNREITITESEGGYKALHGAELLVNTTSVGMAPFTGETPVPAASLGKIPVVYDIVYNPLQTLLLQDAQKTGAKTISGVEMLVWQGALAFEKWTGCEAPLELMRQKAVNLLEQREN